MPRGFCTRTVTNINRRIILRWKYFLALLLAFSLSLPVFSEPETELEIPELKPEAVYEIQGQDLMTLYQTINDLNEAKEEWKNLTNETFQTLEDAVKLAKEYEKENKKLTFQNNFLIGTTVCSVGICVAGVITFMCLNTK